MATVYLVAMFAAVASVSSQVAIGMFRIPYLNSVCKFNSYLIYFKYIALYSEP